MSVETAPPRRRAPLATWGLTLAAALLLPLVLWLITDPVAGHHLVAVSGGRTMRVTPPWVLGGAGLMCALGLALASLLRRFGPGRKIWLVVAPLVLLLSLSSPLGGTTAATIVVLMIMHLLVGGATIYGGLALIGTGAQPR
ncbi:MAG TPA: DUF6069 family protein [Stackebrandtia sp.]|jgi:hypothetical protein|uniref:DUF6069 family protein n=1 Tax=Stackebrandtia sp. TaxID=2023065 RepID=UPI002D582C62|nr:DUF6069 family protein [Stackebrandtia sp.]HZE39408.1 DUF6069 family protein [Stackebrandtia sp.]